MRTVPGCLRRITLIVTGLICIHTMSRGEQNVYTPPPGSQERQDILDVMRLDFYRPKTIEAAHRNADGVLFKVWFLKVHGDWALTNVLPINAAGKDFAEPRWGLLRRKGGRWVDVHYADALGRYHLGDFDAIDMTRRAIQSISRAFPTAPRDIFPKSGGERR